MIFGIFYHSILPYRLKRCAKKRMLQMVSAWPPLTSAQTTPPTEISCVPLSRIITTGQPTDGAGEPEVTLPIAFVAVSSGNICVPVHRPVCMDRAPTRCHAAPPLNSANVLSAP